MDSPLRGGISNSMDYIEISVSADKESGLFDNSMFAFLKLYLIFS